MLDRTILSQDTVCLGIATHEVWASMTSLSSADQSEREKPIIYGLGACMHLYAAVLRYIVSWYTVIIQ